MNSIESSETSDPATTDLRLSSAQKASPNLSHRRLTTMLILMCLIPVGTILTLFQLMPPHHEGELKAAAYTEGLPSDEFYAVKYDERPPFEGGFLVVQNQSEVEWTNLNIQVNKYYSIHDIEPFPAQTERRYELSRFLTRSGARFSIRYNPVKSVMIYARRPTADRATYYHEFDAPESK